MFFLFVVLLQSVIMVEVCISMSSNTFLSFYIVFVHFKIKPKPWQE